MTQEPLRQKSIKLTNYLESLLFALLSRSTIPTHQSPLFTIITPSDSKDRGAQLSLKLRPGLLENVLRQLEERGVVIDERKPDVVRVAPAPLYNTFQDVFDFVEIFEDILKKLA
jgi:kynureninase